MLFIDATYFLLVSVMLVILASDACEDSSTAALKRKDQSLQFISTRLMQCKYTSNAVMRVVPWLFALLIVYTGILYDIALDCLVPVFSAAHFIGTVSYLLLIATGVCLVVRFDEMDNVGRFGNIVFEGYDVDAESLHKIGVVLLFTGIFIANVLILVLLKLHRNARKHTTVTVACLETEYEAVELLYIGLLVAFLVTFFMRLQFVAAILEFCVVVVVIGFTVLARQVYYSHAK